MLKRHHGKGALAWTNGYVETARGAVPVVRTRLGWRDRLGAWKVRWRINRMQYRVPPGLYAVGLPGRSSPVLVTANFKLTFDAVRRELAGIDAWILVLDTKGINVWCAAGKGTFGTSELVNRIRVVKLSEAVDHRRLILPQLGAPGVAAHEVRKQSGFAVIYGPVYARDIPAFISHNMSATEEMRRVRFGFGQRLALVPVEILTACKYGGMGFAVFFILAGFSRQGYSSQAALASGLRGAVFLAAGIGAGTVVTPVLLPWLPGRMFSVKGFIAGLLVLALLACGLGDWLFSQAGLMAASGLALTALAISSFAGMNFTGSSTFTSLSGVRKEMRRAVPLQVMLALVGAVLWGLSRFLG